MFDFLKYLAIPYQGEMNIIIYIIILVATT